jgi:hypothetical protein
MRALLLALVALLVAPAACAQDAGVATDFTVRLARGQPPQAEDPQGVLSLVEAVPGERLAWNVTIAKDYATGTFVLGDAFDVARPRQVVPTLEVGEGDDPFFTPFPGADVRQADAPARVFTLTREGGADVLRLGLPGPLRATLRLTRDVTPPRATLAGPDVLTPHGFLVEARTDEPALGDLQVRAKGSGGAWLDNPTTAYATLQRFPVQGLDGNATYEARLVSTDWAGNEAVSPVFEVVTPPEPARPAPTLTPLSPAPDATLPPGRVTVRVRVDDTASPLAPGAWRLFVDKHEVPGALRAEGDELVYDPPQAFDAGTHALSVEATNAAGGTGLARWSFQVAPAAATPGSLAPLAILALAAAGVLVGMGIDRPR